MADNQFVPEEILDTVFGGLDTALSSVDTALKNARINADLTKMRDSLRKAGDTAASTVRQVRTSPVPQGQSLGLLLWQRLLALLPVSLRRLFQKTEPAPMPREEDIPYVADEEPPAQEPEPVVEIPTSGNEQADALIAQQKREIADIEDAATLLYRHRPQTALQLERILDIYRRILAALATHPGKAGDLRRFTSYYIPTLKKFTDTYAALCRRTVHTKKESDTMAEIEHAFTQIEEGFRKKLDDMFSGDALDISADVSVLDTMLRNE